MIPVSEAVEIVLKETPTLGTASVSTIAALNRVLGEDIVADTDLPPFDRSQMDGYAVRADDIQQAPATLRVVGESIAGKGWHLEMKAGEAVRIMTGAPVPTGADAVQQVELTRNDNQQTVEILEAAKAGKSIVRQGTEIRSGQTILQAGETVNAAMVAVLASFGYDKVKVGVKPRVAVLATGSELVAVNETPGRDQIRDSNNYSLAAYAELAGAHVELLPLAGDDLNLLKKQIGSAAECADVVVTSGGVSMGVYDFTKAALKELGAEIFFEKVALRPGKPTVFGRLPGGALVFGLPGNPVSVAVTFNLFTRPSLLRMQNATQVFMEQHTAVLGRSLKGSTDRESYLPAQLSSDASGRLIAEPLKWSGSSDFVAFARARALIVLPAGHAPMSEGELVKIVILPTCHF